MAFILPGVNKIRAVFNLVASIVMVVIFFFVAPSGIVEKFRIGQAVQDLHLMANSQYNTSLGIRLVLWKSALLDFNESPILGVGEGVFQKNFEQRVNKGEIPAVSAFNQPHSDIFHALSSGGILKLIGYLGIIFAPFIFFLTKSRGLNIKPDHRLMSILGLEVVGSYFITGLTNSNFDLQIYSTTYAVLVCVLAKLSSLDDSAAINAAEPSKPSTPATPSC
jgi:O-antigen ligase